MQTIAKIAGITALAAVVIFSMTTCSNDPDDDNNGPTHYTGTLKMSGQVWLQNKETNRINDMTYLKYTGEDKEINIFPAFSYDSDGNLTRSMEPAGSGTITNRVLSFTVDELTDDNLIQANDLKRLFREWDDVQITPSTAKGNIIYPETTDGKLFNREGLTGTKTSISLESILYIYVNMNCTITGNPGNRKDWPSSSDDGYFSYTDSNLNVSLQKGWSTVCRKQTYTGNSAEEGYGYEKETIEMKNPNDFKWVLYTQQ
jgi:hypothetical protein